MLPSVWSSFSKVIVAAFGNLLSGSRDTLDVSLSTRYDRLFHTVGENKKFEAVWSVHGLLLMSLKIPDSEIDYKIL
jgi:hypothetical protein